MKSVQNSLDSSKNSAASAQDIGNKAIKNVAQGIQNTSWMFDKFSNLLDELAAAFDDVAPATAAKSSTEDAHEVDTKDANEDTSSSSPNDPAQEVTTEQQAIMYQLSSVAAEEAKQKHHCGKAPRKNIKAQKEDSSEEETDDDASAIEEVGASDSNVVVSDNVVEESTHFAAKQNAEADEKELPNVEDKDDESLEEPVLTEALPHLSQDLKNAPDTKEVKIPNNTQENDDKGDKGTDDKALPFVEKGQESYQQHASAKDELQQSPELKEELPVEARQKPKNAEDLTGLPAQDKFQNKVLSPDGSQNAAQGLAQQQATAQSFQSAVKSAQSAVSQTVESVREMIKELSSVSSASSLAKSVGQANVSLAAQVKVDRSDVSSGKNSPPLTRTQILRTLERVESTLKEIVKAKDGKSISLRLDPPSLGSLKIDISYREGNLHARIVPESSQVALALRDRAHELQTILRRVGIDAMQVSVTIASPSSSGQEMPSHAGNYFLHEHAEGERGEGSQGGEQFSSGSENAPEEKKKDVLNQGGDKNLDHWVA